VGYIIASIWACHALLPRLRRLWDASSMGVVLDALSPESP